MSDFVRLGDHITIAKGKPPAQVPFDGPGATPYLTPEYLRGRTLALPAKPGMDAVAVANGDAVLLWDGSNAGEFFHGKAGLAASTMARLRADGTIDRAFFVHALKHLEPRLKSQTNGTGIPHVDRQVLEGFRVFRPDSTEQNLVAEILDTLDTTIRQTEAIIEKLKQVKQGLLHDLLTRGIDANGELRPPQSQAPHLYKDSPLGWVPREWEVLALAHVSMSVGDGVHHAVERSSAGVPFLFVSCVRNGTIDWSSASFVTQTIYSDLSKRCRPKKGMILFTAVGSYGHAAHVDDDRDFGFERNIAFILPNSRLVQSRFLFHFLSSTATRAQVERLVIGNAQKVLTLTALNSLLTVRPPTEEQSLISAVLDAASNRVAGETKVGEKLRLQKSGLMDDLLTGRVRVTPLLNATP